MGVTGEPQDARPHCVAISGIYHSTDGHGSGWRQGSRPSQGAAFVRLRMDSLPRSADRPPGTFWPCPYSSRPNVAARRIQTEFAPSPLTRTEVARREEDAWSSDAEHRSPEGHDSTWSGAAQVPGAAVLLLGGESLLLGAAALLPGRGGLLLGGTASPPRRRKPAPRRGSVAPRRRKVVPRKTSHAPRVVQRRPMEEQRWPSPGRGAFPGRDDPRAAARCFGHEKARALHRVAG